MHRDPTTSNPDLDAIAETITVSFVWDLRRVLGAARAHARVMTSAIPFPAWLLVVALLALISASSSRALLDGRAGLGGAGLGAMPLILTAVVLLIAPVALVFGIQIAFHQVFNVASGAARLMEWHIDAQAIRVMTQASEAPTRIRWSEIQRLIKTPRGYLLYIHPTLPTWLPRDAFEEDDDRLAFEALLRRKLGPGARGEV